MYLAQFLVVHIPDGYDLLGVGLLDGCHLLLQPVVVDLQGPDPLDVGGQPAVKGPELPLLLGPGHLGGRQRRWRTLSCSWGRAGRYLNVEFRVDPGFL